MSAAPFDSLNFAAHVGDDPEQVEKNLAIAGEDLGVDPGRDDRLRFRLLERAPVAVQIGVAEVMAPVAVYDAVGIQKRQTDDPETFAKRFSELRVCIQRIDEFDHRNGTRHFRRMLAADPVDGRRGTILFTGASAGVKGFAQSAPFAMGKFAQRGLAESMARELHPQGIHVAWINIDGAILNPGRTEPADAPGSMLRPEAIALSYRHLVEQDRSAWTSELAIRPWVERF